MSTKSDVIIKPISKSLLIGGHIFVFLFIFAIIGILFFIPAKRVYSADLIIISDNKVSKGYCIISAKNYKNLDLNSFQLSEDEVKQYNCRPILSNKLYDKYKEEYILVFDLEYSDRSGIPISIVNIHFNVNASTPISDLIFK